ncbi:MAG TPA: metal ABC transporter substrate-binding protein [Selenomonadales bacterium]|nr:metal ABC transporter substrate-binding protein [Selenomonadales bacterium]
MRKRLFGILCLTLLMVVFTSGLGLAAKPTIVTTIYPLYDFTKQVVGDKADVALLVPAGAEPHDWEPAPADMIKIKNAKMFVYNGAGMEEWIDKLQGSVLKGKKVVKASDYVNVLAAQFTEEGEPAPAGISDPHIWLDPVNAQAIVQGIADAVSAMDPANGSYYKSNASHYIAELQALDQEYQILGNAPRKQIVTSHAAFAYMAKRYGLQQVAIMGLAPDAEPTPQRMAEVIRYVKANGIRYIFFETLVSPKLSEVIASEAGAQTLVLNPIEGLTDEEIAQGANYITEMRMNLTNLKIALGVN